MAGEGRYVLVKPDGSRLTLPPDAIVTSGDGETLQVELDRAVEADKWEEFGDEMPIPTPLVLELTVNGGSESEVSVLSTNIWMFARTATRLERDGRVYRTLRRARSCVAQHTPGDGTDQRLTLTLLPSESKWRSIADNTERLF